MRPQQGRRQRNRGNNNNRNRNQNPLSRSYESNGPDVKIRGNAQQVADKYEQLARDAQSSGDRVMVESYLQHAEHYKRIIMAHQQAQAQEREEREQQRQKEMVENGENDQTNSGENNGENHNDQPVIEGTPEEVKLAGEEADAAKPKPRRTRRPRKTDDTPEAEAVATDDSGDEQPAPRRRTRRPRKTETEETVEAANDASPAPEASDASEQQAVEA
ncbi:MAG: DUF4167 domain-containing protein [Pseudomonadota bacterium]